MWLLIVIAISFVNGAGSTVAMHDFKTQAQCEVAKAAIQGMANFQMKCVPLPKSPDA